MSRSMLKFLMTVRTIPYKTPIMSKFRTKTFTCLTNSLCQLPLHKCLKLRSLILPSSKLRH